MKSRVYLETTVVSYLVAEPTKDIIQTAHQQITRQWWAGRDRFDIFVSRAVIGEARRVMRRLRFAVLGFFEVFPGWRVVVAARGWRRHCFDLEHCRGRRRSTLCTWGSRPSTGSTTC